MRSLGVVNFKFFSSKIHSSLVQSKVVLFIDVSFYFKGGEDG